jgi:hypothetical protein
MVNKYFGVWCKNKCNHLRTEKCVDVYSITIGWNGNCIINVMNVVSVSHCIGNQIPECFTQIVFKHGHLVIL